MKKQVSYQAALSGRSALDPAAPGLRAGADRGQPAPPAGRDRRYIELVVFAGYGPSGICSA